MVEIQSPHIQTLEACERRQYKPPSPEEARASSFDDEESSFSSITEGGEASMDVHRKSRLTICSPPSMKPSMEPKFFNPDKNRAIDYFLAVEQENNKMDNNNDDVSFDFNKLADSLRGSIPGFDSMDCSEDQHTGFTVLFIVIE
ncbi:hypothetical protein QYF36_005643 [Acer negundo]|nr:hypothetical protein QYF36_005643 [Acer negundo]